MYEQPSTKLDAIFVEMLKGIEDNIRNKKHHLDTTGSIEYILPETFYIGKDAATNRRNATQFATLLEGQCPAILGSDQSWRVTVIVKPGEEKIGLRITKRIDTEA